ncbi:bifunctional alpha,alpha-trehalose-phosphate synthase (UDP-forming)/trehalose-phosphatase [Anditalea andensis]|uniref:Trehalose-6-phosphate synthase n=1 Tax=Anditalea andensis TaxID=1048983 RepID=A0A074L4E0_9BACT|nr:bifunctional alpha,alpha-trehalose-phosphate synthase (UDP-forming)/trehalose-phosphatase [Anditalea andensis]KEO75360.1 trehalose-6-phosphate synthase [Anditalea andensis]
MGKTIFVSHRLPINGNYHEGKFHFTASSGEVASGLYPLFEKQGDLWIAWPGAEIKESEIRASLILELSAKKMHPVFLTQEEIDRYHGGFCNETLWPTFHSFTQYINYNENNWDAYVAVNRKFCDAILKKAKPEDTVWIHDYQLLLLPEMLRKRMPDLTIGFFQHTPFPSYEIFRMLPWRQEVLRGMCGADLIGFHIYDDMRHFLSSIGRILGHTDEAGFIHTDSRLINVDSFPMGIDYEKLQKAAKCDETENLLRTFREDHHKQTFILSCDRLDYTKGIPERIKAFELFLDTYPAYVEKISLLLLVAPSRTTVKKYRALKEEIDTLVGRINSKYSTLDWVPIHYFYRKFSFEENVAFYRLADIALVSTLREGMNFISKEYIASRTKEDGVLILSEMTGASKELQEAIIINPNDKKSVCRAIFEALNMPLEEKQKRMRRMQYTVQKYSIYQWARIYINRLKHVKTLQQSLHSRELIGKDLETIQTRFEEAEHPIVFLDYDGALVGYTSQPDEAFPDPKLLEILDSLCEKANIVIISGRDKMTMDKWLEGYKLNMIAEHGVFVKKNHGMDNNWATQLDISNDWKSSFRIQMDDYVERTPGAFIEEKEHSIVWHYRKVESGLGNLRKRELFSHLKYMARGLKLEVLEGNRALEIKRPEASKSKAIIEYLENESADFVLVIGDNWTDEDTFRDLSDNAITIRVGYDFTRAQYNLKSHLEVRKLLETLCNVNNKIY